MSQPQPDWYPDPTHRNRLRFWDGSQWTAHVSVGGVPAADPLGAPYLAAGFSAGRAQRRTRLAAAAATLGVFAAAMWFAWLGWDHEYYYVDGVAQGPYRAWQVVGCGLAIGAAAVLTHLWVRQPAGVWLLAAAADVGLAVPWAVDAASSDESGLWVAGLVLLLGGGGVALLTVLALTQLAVGLRRPGGRSART
jgi:hypothetical protein